MEGSMRTLLLLATLLTVPVAALAQDGPVQQVMAVRAGIGPAMRTQNSAALEKIWSPEMTVNSPGNKIMDRSAVLKRLGAGAIKYSAFKDVVESTSVFKDDLVIIMGHEELTEAVGPDAGKPKVRRYTDVWQRNLKGSWMLIARQATYVANP
jgi:hypothetical protein